MKYLPGIFESNRAWAARQTGADPEFFSRLSGIQRPDYLWIGCSDSRVPANQIVDLDPGELFVHRNVANIVVADDPNCMGVVEYAVNVLEVKHVIVCGHYGCGGVRAALEDNASGFVGEWLGPLRAIADGHRTELDGLPDLDARWARLCELNVEAQVGRLAATEIIRRRWSRDPSLVLHGWIYDLHDGLLRDLDVSVDGKTAG